MSGAAVNSFDHFGWTPLHEAANHGDVPTIKALLKHPSADVNTVGAHEVKKLGMTPLHDAAGERLPPSLDAVGNHNMGGCLLACPSSIHRQTVDSM